MLGNFAPLLYVVIRRADDNRLEDKLAEVLFRETKTGWRSGLKHYSRFFSRQSFSFSMHKKKTKVEHEECCVKEHLVNYIWLLLESHSSLCSLEYS